MSTFKDLQSKFLRALAQPLMRITGLAGVPASLRETVQLVQIDTRSRLSVKMAVVGETVLLAFAYGFIHKPGMRLFYGFVLLVSVAYGTLIWLGRIWRNSARKRHIFSGFQRNYCAVQLLLGVAWSGVIATALPHADTMQLAQVYAILIGLLSTAVFSGPALYSLMFWTPLVVGSTITLFPFQAHTALSTFIGIIAYDVLCFLTILELNRKLVEREVGALRIARLKEESELLLRDFQRGSSDWLFELDRNLMIVHPSERFCEVALRDDTSMQIRLETLLRNGDHSVARHGDDGIADLMSRFAGRTSFRDITVPVPLGGEIRWWDLSAKPIFDQAGDFAGYRGVGRDITDLYRSRERVVYLAHHDALTSLLNRDLFSSTLQRAITSGDGSETAVLCVDLDYFKSINDSFGHGVGDHLLRAAADRFSACVREKDMVFRLGGDEFAMVLPDVRRFEAALVAQRIVDSIALPFRINELTLSISASVGIAMLPTDADTPEEIHHRADLALYEAKTNGRGRFDFFDSSSEDAITRRIAIHNDLKDAVTRRDDLFLEYQPIVELHSGRSTSLEALVRWKHPIQGLIGPTDFIPAAEESGLIASIGAHVIKMTCCTAARLADDISVAINLSPRQLCDDSLLSTISEALERNELPGRRVEFEITETTVLEASGYNRGILDRIRALGCRIVLDDFGTGYSSFRSLDAFQFDRIKIAQPLLDDVVTHPKRRAILETIVAMGIRIGIDVVAEGIETKDQADLLRSFGCPLGQGFLFSRPIPESLAVRRFGGREMQVEKATAASLGPRQAADQATFSSAKGGVGPGGPGRLS